MVVHMAKVRPHWHRALGVDGNGNAGHLYNYLTHWPTYVISEPRRQVAFMLRDNIGHTSVIIANVGHQHYHAARDM